MIIYTYAEASKDLSALLDKARNSQEVFIQKENGEMFAVRFFFKKKTEYNLPDTDLGLTRNEIVSYVREVRERNG
jgi:hypothetical protein